VLFRSPPPHNTCGSAELTWAGFGWPFSPDPMPWESDAGRVLQAYAIGQPSIPFRRRLPLGTSRASPKSSRERVGQRPGKAFHLASECAPRIGRANLCRIIGVRSDRDSPPPPQERVRPVLLCDSAHARRIPPQPCSRRNSANRSSTGNPCNPPDRIRS
jgi:hypothetical protein